MAEKKKNEESAFPYNITDEDGKVYHETGMTIRDVFSGRAITGMMANPNVITHEKNTKEIAEFCYDLADRLMEVRDK